ncbi:OmpA family protein [Heliobacterium chlorum]|uniref:OmpA family protein n=1 Tax=Heliobacterium chlorum TaxID=2698 RepID=A0ABR7T149_HELCL|nr:OmpA family protein [Heliobacterium chlorum]MBC9784411.1 OmpA family protein [Heliobacterium chlorum]
MKRKRRLEEHWDEKWLIPYADMLTLLLALFIVMFATSRVDPNKFEALSKTMVTVFTGNMGIMRNATPVPTADDNDKMTDMAVLEAVREARQLEETKSHMDKYIQDQGLQNQIETNLLQEGLQISFRDAALFDSGKATLNQESMPNLDIVGRLLAEMKQNEVRIAGHTDNLPIKTAEFPSNWELSTERALNVMKYLLRNKDLNPVQFTAVGYGEYHPKASNDTADGRSMNRRVEIMLVRKYSNQALPKTDEITSQPFVPSTESLPVKGEL